MYVTQIVAVRLQARAADVLSHRTFVRASEWLTQWTPRGNFKAVLTDTSAQGVEHCRNLFRKKLVPSWLDVSPDLFEFEVSTQELDEDRFFWMPSSLVRGCWHKVGEQP